LASVKKAIKKFVESQHLRYPAGTGKGGRFRARRKWAGLTNEGGIYEPQYDENGAPIFSKKALDIFEKIKHIKDPFEFQQAAFDACWNSKTKQCDSLTNQELDYIRDENYHLYS
jgi:hypothetical protein